MDVQPVINKIDDDEGRRSQQAFTKFIKSYEDGEGQKVYLEQVDELTNPERNTLEVEFSHIMGFSAVLASTIELQFYRLYPYLCLAIRDLVVERCDDETLQLQLRRKLFYLGITGVKIKHQIRHLTSDKIGKLVRISGQVVRTHPVHPELSLGTFVCDDCGVTAHNVVQQFKYTQPVKCENQQCLNRTRFKLNVYDSQFVDYQRLRIQETQDELPLGSVPRNVDVVVRGEIVETAQPGDHCDFIGTLIVVPDVAMLATPGVRSQPKTHTRSRDQKDDRFNLKGLKSLGVRDLSYKMAFLACSIAPSNPAFGGVDFTHEDVSPTELWSALVPEDQEKLKEMSEDTRIVEHLCDSLFPNIYGNREVKLGILLQLFGGVAKRAAGTTLRGDINICLIGDPSCGKSQFLKTVEKFSPRVIYTSGKASSAAGLTAAVVKDEESFDFVIEAGALMLADNGVCCIDEFDKMDLKDQVAIHEAMEQQTISITKAGVKATLNARCSILAAANPNGGKYELSQPLRHNVSLSAPIISRFDLFFVLVDSNDNPIVDYEIAKRILDNHRNAYNRVASDNAYNVEDIRKYIMFARCFRPQISDEAERALKAAYLKLRLADDGQSARITVRQLESLIRLSEAYARLKCAAEVTIAHVKMAHDLLSKAIIRVNGGEVSLEDDDEADYDFAGALAPDAPLQDVTNQSANGTSQDASKAPAGGTDPKQLRISHERYTNIANMLVTYLREEEERHGEQEDWEGTCQTQLVEWYMKMIEPDLEKEQDYWVQKAIIDRMIPRLVRDHVLVQLATEDGEEGADEVDKNKDHCLLVHPNYVADRNE